MSQVAFSQNGPVEAEVAFVEAGGVVLMWGPHQLNNYPSYPSQ